MADVHSKCANCRYFLNAEIMGSCRRYPQTINRHMNDWCGEHDLAIQMYELEPSAVVQEPKIAEKDFEERISAMSIGVVEMPNMLYDIATDSYKAKRKYTRKEKA